MTARIIYKTGQRLRDNSLLTYINDVESDPRNREAMFMCDCGKKVSLRIANIKNGNTLSCGCFNAQASSNRSTTHGMSNTNIYDVWAGIISRCTNENKGGFKNYGGRGITVCDDWKSFDKFYADMGDRPEGMSIDRIDNDKGYSKGNCRWATRSEQCRNRRSSLLLTFQGKTQCAASWADDLAISRHAIYLRLYRGWSVERALSTLNLP